MSELEGLTSYFKDLGTAVLAFSGGVDSTLLLAVGAEALGDKLVAISLSTPYVPAREMAEAEALANELGVRREVISVPIVDEIRNKPKDTCYVCKHHLFGLIQERANALGIPHVVDGTNVDDLSEYRPGRKALAEYGVKSPLAELGITKERIRAMSKELGLPTWDKPSYSCLLSRIPVGTPVREEALSQIEAAEEWLQDLGFRGMRVRMHGTLARIEVPATEIPRLAADGVRQAVVERLKSLGFQYVTLDLLGYQTGSMS